MTMEDGALAAPMGVWIALATAAVVVVVAVALSAWRVGYARGRDAAGERRRADGAAVGGAAFGNGAATGDAASLFGDAPVRETELGFIATLPEGVLLADGEGEVRYASPEALALLDRSQLDRSSRRGGGTARVRSDTEVSELLRLVSDDGRLREREIVVAPVSPDATTVTPDGRGVAAGGATPGDERHLKVRVGVVGDDLFAILLSDISEQRRFEAMRRDFVTNVSHELKTPAGAIALLAETVGDAADDPDAVRYFAGRITKESERLTDLVHRLIDLQKAQSAASTPDLSPVNVLAIARAALAASQVEAESHDITLLLALDGRSVPLEASDSDGSNGSSDSGPAVLADEEALTGAVRNLIENAIHYSPERTTVRVAIATASAATSTSASGSADADAPTPAEPHVTIRVIDQGIGIPREALGRVFERFYRVDPARSRATGGTGLGLSIAKHAVEECGGTISVWSQPGEGSTFTIDLPAADSGYHGTGEPNTKGEA